jgi:hypothetical protein
VQQAVATPAATQPTPPKAGPAPTAPRCSPAQAPWKAALLNVSW